MRRCFCSWAVTIRPARAPAKETCLLFTIFLLLLLKELLLLTSRIFYSWGRSTFFSGFFAFNRCFLDNFDVFDGLGVTLKHLLELFLGQRFLDRSHDFIQIALNFDLGTEFDVLQ